MAKYANGKAPLSVMVHLGGNIYLPPGTYRRWLRLVARVKRDKGVTLRITPDRDGLGGWNGYRPIDPQKAYKRALGSRAAAPGYSSHGLTYGGQECAALDVDNWQQVGWAYFKSAAEAEGFTVDFVSPREQWHIGDFNDIWTVPKEEDVVTHIDRSFKLTKPQTVKAGADFAGLLINDKRDVSVATHAHDHVAGNLHVRVHGGKAFAGAVQIRPVVRDWKHGETVKVRSLGVREIIFTGGDTFAAIPVDAKLGKDQRLSFQIGESTHDITVVSARFIGSAIN